MAALAATVPCLQVPPRWRAIEFVSDIHLSEQAPDTAEAFFRRLAASQADAMFVLGDLFDVWVGDDALDEPGFERDCANRMRVVGESRALYFMAGNRDFLVGDRFLRHCHAQRLEDPTCVQAWGMRVLLTHGDAWCLADGDYQRFRRQVRDPAWRADVLSRPLQERRGLAAQIRRASEQRKTERGADSYGDVDVNLAAAWLQASKASVLIHGHTHQPSSGAWTAGTTRHVLSDWHGDALPPRGDLLRWSATGFERLSAFNNPATA